MNNNTSYNNPNCFIKRDFDEYNQEESTERKVGMTHKDLAEKAHSKMRRRLKYDWKIKDLLFNSIGIFSCLCCCISKFKQTFRL